MSEAAVPTTPNDLQVDRPVNQPRRAALRARSWGVFGAALCLAGAAWTTLPQPRAIGAPEAQRAAVHVRAAPARRAPGMRAHSFSGIVRAENQALLSFVGGGRLLMRKVEAGDSVKQRQLLARIDAKPVRNAERALTAQRMSLITQRDQLARDLARVAQLHAQGASTPQQEEQLSAQRSVVESNIAAIEAQLAEHQRQGAEAELFAPFAGVVTEVLAEEGEVLSPGQPVLRIAAPSGTEVEVRVPESIVAALSAGMLVNVRFPLTDLAPQSGEIVAIGRSAVAGRALFPVRVRIADASRLRSGMTAEVTFHVDDGERVLVPADAIAAPTGRRAWVLALDAEDRVRTVTVQVDGATSEGILVKAELSDGERVVVGAPAGLVSGTRVSVTP